MGTDKRIFRRKKEKHLQQHEKRGVVSRENRISMAYAAKGFSPGMAVDMETVKEGILIRVIQGILDNAHDKAAKEVAV